MSESTSKSSLTFEELHSLLLNQRSNLSLLPKTSHKDVNPPPKELTDALELFGVVSPDYSSVSSSPLHSQAVWRRTIPSTLYSTPYLPSQTTLVPLSFVPIPIRNKLGLSVYNNSIATSTEEEEKIVVEISISSLVPTPEQDTVQPLQLQKHDTSLALGASKLQEYYTRGSNTLSASQKRPFQPGLSKELDLLPDYDQQQKQKEEEGISNNPYTTPEALQTSREALHYTGLEAYQRGLLLTKPPGVRKDFVGLTPENVYPQLHHEKIEQTEETGYVEENGKDEDIKRIQDSAVARQRTQALTEDLWDKHALLLVDDNDSLFGSSSSSNSSSSRRDDEGYSSEEEQEDEEAEEEGEEQKENDVHDKAPTPQEHDQDDEEDVDTLLDTLISYQSTIHTKHEANPVYTSLLDRTSSTSYSSARKSWAVTAELDISDFYTRVVPNPAMKFPFELDTFQKQAVARLERNQCIFIAAHTSAGKTVCAEYAIALSQKHCTRAIYTSPIKALSNQKFRDFKHKFGEDVGLITGDIQVNPSATCLIMTTEILRSMLYRGADLVRDIEWVIFDEIHYVNDVERGAVWEEVIIMLPDYVKLVFLSATTPNTIEFCDWIGRTKRKPIHVIRTNYRPVPLSHYLYAGNKLHCIMEGRPGFLAKGYSEAAKALLPSSATKNTTAAGGGNKQAQPPKPAVKTGSKQWAWQQQGSRGEWAAFVKFLEREELTPSVVFSFSKKKCEEIANMIRSMDLNTAAERAAVTGFTEQAIKRLNPSDASLPQVQNTCEMAKRGVACHHGGLLPILKEMVEILFSRNLIKVLFATETFAMGVNMPARSVAFSSIRKHDGAQFRELTAGEYTQMSGRSGRRSIDKVIASLTLDRDTLKRYFLDCFTCCYPESLQLGVGISLRLLDSAIYFVVVI